jgi:hypothetical protein
MSPFVPRHPGGRGSPSTPGKPWVIRRGSGQSFQKNPAKTRPSWAYFQQFKAIQYRFTNHLFYGTIIYDNHNECSTLR